MKKNYLFLIMLLFGTFSMMAQTYTITGTVTEGSSDALIGVSIIKKGTSVGTVTDVDGKYSLEVTNGDVLEFTYVGYEPVTVTIDGQVEANVMMSTGLALDEVVVTGNRSKPRTVLDSPVPIDNINASELRSSGKQIIERMLTYKVPSFNSQNQAISDATAHYDPADLRGLGPSRTLVLINGKRKNQSAQVYLNRTPGKGEVGIDLKSIPTAAVERVEVLRDGASAQYGSDAIAGVINMVLKKDAEYSVLTANTGITSKGDGFNLATDFNTAFNLGEGNVNLTLGYYNQKITNRAGTPGEKDLPPAPNAADYDNTADYDQAVLIYNNWKDFVTKNPDIGMHVGQPALKKGDLFVNITHPIGDGGEFYSFHGFTSRLGQSFAYYRAPYWRQDPVGNSGFLTRPEDFIGYQPTFETAIKDNIDCIGVKYDLGEKWKVDASATYGSNSVMYTVNNSVNRDYLKDHGTSPRTFHPGGYSLSNIIGNLDFTGLLSEKISVAIGGEYKVETFKAFEGDPISYYKGGSDSFAGIKPAEAGKWDRNNVAGYAQIDYDITDALLLGVAGRFEQFSDVGSNFSWKVNGRYKIGEKGAIRGSYSTGFRAPTLHQRYLTNSQYIIVSGSNEPLLQGTLANDNPAVQALGVPKLFPETSQNLSFGLTYKLATGLSASFDVYQINVKDRVLFSSQIGAIDGALDGSDAVETILQDNNVVAVQFFINAGDTKTQGLDFVVNYKNGAFGVDLAANFNTTTLEAVTTPKALKDNGYNIFDRQEVGLIINSRPKSKILFGLNYNTENWYVALNNTLFGKVTVTSPSAGYDTNGVEQAKGIDQELASQLVTDFAVSYKFSERLSLNANVNNLLDKYPTPTDPATKTSQAGTRFIYSSEVQQQGQLGRNYRIGLTLSF